MVAYAATCGYYRNPISRPIVDKRTFFAAAALFLRINGYRLNATNDELEKFTLGVAQSRHELAEIATWLHAHVATAEK